MITIVTFYTDIFYLFIYLSHVETERKEMLCSW